MAAAQFGHYRLEQPLGSGGMGQVWAARDTRDGRRVALKLLPAELADDAVYRARFEREAVLAAALRAPNIPAIHGHGSVDGRLYIEMELVEGADLSARLAAGGPLDPHAAVDILAQVAAALDAAHAAGLIHRDVKPSNILVRPDGFAYLIDFGIARTLGQTSVTATGLTIGTWAYMAPERFTGHADARSDIYSLACVLFESLTGRRPYGDTEPAEQMHGHLMTAPPRAAAVNPAVPAALDEVLARGMAKEPAERQASAGEFVRAARTAIDGRAGAGDPGVADGTRALSRPDPAPTRRETALAAPIPARAPNPTRVLPATAPFGAVLAPAAAPPAAAPPAAPAGRGRWVPPRDSRPADVVPAPPRAEPRPPAPRRRVDPPLPRQARRPAPRPQPWTPRKRRRRGGFLRTLLWATVLIVVAPCVFAVGCLAVLATDSSDGSAGQDAPPPVAEVEEPAPGPAAIAPAGTPVRDGKFEFRVAALDSGERVGIQHATGSFLIVTLAVHNHSDEVKWFLPFGQKLVLGDGTVVEHDATATAWQAVQHRQGHTFELQPGASGTAVLVFDVPDSASAAHLELHDFVLSDGVSVALY